METPEAGEMLPNSTNVQDGEVESGDLVPEEGGEQVCADENAGFQDVKYWNHFYSEDQDIYDWYSTEEWLAGAIPDAVVRAMCGDRVESMDARDVARLSSLALLDVGCGTCPLIFDLVRAQMGSAGSSEGSAGTVGGLSVSWRSLIGVDFVQSVMDAMNVYAAELTEEYADATASVPSMSFSAADACDMRAIIDDASIDVVFDKGCLDCFISGDGEGSIIVYLNEICRVLSDSGVVVFICTNGSDVAHLLQSGGQQIREDPHCVSAGGGHASAARQKWRDTKQKGLKLNESGTPLPLSLERIHAFDQKHMFVCKRTPRAVECEVTTPAPVTLQCGVCGHSWTFPDFPNTCDKCSNNLQRFALS